MSRPQRKSPDEWSRRLSWCLDLLSLGALAGTFEVRAEVLAAVGVACLVSQAYHRTLRKNLGDHLLLGLLLAVIVGAVGYGWRFRQHPIEVAAQAAPLAHALVWFAADTVRYRGWRLGLGFIELVLASALTTELYLPAAIFLFVILSSVSISCAFLATQLELRSPTRASEPLPSSFVRDSLGTAFLIFLTSAIIFPILPRRNLAMDTGLGLSRVDYTEEVTLSSLSRGLDSSSGQALLRFYPPSGVDLSLELHLGLVRGAVLDAFDGGSWRPAFGRRALPADNPPPSAGGLWVDVVREPLNTEILPVPYGVSSLSLASLESPSLTGMFRYPTGEWLVPRSLRKRVAYRFALAPNFRMTEGSEDRPREVHRRLPRSARTERITALAKRIFKERRGPSSESLKIAQLRQFFAESGFRAVYGTETETPKGTGTISPIERFLFVTHEGHCEHFASAGALLLREAGVAARLVSGFRLTRAAGPGAPLTLRSSDAHAWIEAWSPGQGWIPIDLTPRVLQSDSWSSLFLDAYDRMSAYWYRYVVTYDEQAQTEIGAGAARSWREGSADNLSRWGSKIRSALNERLDRVALGVVVAALAAGLALWLSRVLSLPPWLSWRRWRSIDRDRRDWVRARLRVGRWLSRNLPTETGLDLRDTLPMARQRWGDKRASELVRWIELYERGRFGTGLGGSELKELKLIETRLRSPD